MYNRPMRIHPVRCLINSLHSLNFTILINLNFQTKRFGSTYLFMSKQHSRFPPVVLSTKIDLRVVVRITQIALTDACNWIRYREFHDSLQIEFHDFLSSIVFKRKWNALQAVQENKKTMPRNKKSRNIGIKTLGAKLADNNDLNDCNFGVGFSMSVSGLSHFFLVLLCLTTFVLSVLCLSLSNIKRKMQIL